MQELLDRFLEHNRTSFWPWLVLVAVLSGVGYAWYGAGRAAQNAMDRDHTVRFGAHQSVSARTTHDPAPAH